VPSIAGVEIHIFAKKEWSALIFLPLWLAIWTFAGIVAMKWVLRPAPSTPRAFVSLWLVGWALGEAWAVYSWSWTAFGKEILEVKEGVLTTKRDILGLGRSRRFPIGSVANLRASGIFPSSSNWENYLTQMKLGGGTVAFDSQGKIVRFGIQLTEPEAQEVVRELKPWLPG
jgi:hypothetical protein